jgi:hypothetical protein
MAKDELERLKKSIANAYVQPQQKSIVLGGSMNSPSNQQEIILAK